MLWGLLEKKNTYQDQLREKKYTFALNCLEKETVVSEKLVNNDFKIEIKYQEYITVT